MFHTKQLNNLINSLYEKASRVTYQGRNSSFSELLNFDKSVSVHYRNTKYLLVEIYKVKMFLSPPIMSDISSLSENSSYNQRSVINVRASKFSFETISTIGAILWNDLPAELKNAESLKTFRQKIKLWSPNNYVCKICRKFLKKIGIHITSKPPAKKMFLKLLRKKTCSKFSKVYYLQKCIRYYRFCYYHC